LTTVDNIPLLPRLRTLMLARNKIAAIGEQVASNAPNLTSLVLTENELSNIDSLRPLQPLAHLIRLTVVDNPIMQVPDARLAIIHLLPQLRVLNFQRVRQRERAAAKAKFGESKLPSKKRLRADAADAGGAAVASTSSSTSSAAATAKTTTSAKRARLTTEQQVELAKKIANATSMQEVERLEAALRDNRMPDD
jgi:U2 small nuclear ribonucleoprotein A'